MSGKRILVAIGGTGCAIVIFGSCIFASLFFAYTSYFYGDLPSTADNPDLWYEIPGESYAFLNDNCPTGWEDIGGDFTYAKYCENLVHPPSVAEGMPTGVIVTYEGFFIPRVESVELIISPYNPDPPTDSEHGHIDGFDFAATVEEFIELDDCTPTFMRFYNSGAWSCEGRKYIYSGTISEEPDVQNEMRLWIARSYEDVSPRIIEVVKDEHRRVADLFMRRGDDALELDDYIDAEFYYGQAYFFMERIQDLDSTTEDQQLIARAQQARQEIIGAAREQRMATDIPAPRPRYYGFINLPALVAQSYDSVRELLNTGSMSCEFDGEGFPEICTFGDRVHWAVNVTFCPIFGNSRSVEVVVPNLDMPFDKEALHLLNLPVVPPDHEDENVLRWNDIVEHFYVELRREEGLDFPIAKISAK